MDARRKGWASNKRSDFERTCIHPVKSGFICVCRYLMFDIFPTLFVCLLSYQVRDVCVCVCVSEHPRWLLGFGFALVQFCLVFWFLFIHRSSKKRVQVTHYGVSQLTHTHTHDTYTTHTLLRQHISICITKPWMLNSSIHQHAPKANERRYTETENNNKEERFSVAARHTTKAFTRIHWNILTHANTHMRRHTYMCMCAPTLPIDTLKPFTL